MPKPGSIAWQQEGANIIIAKLRERKPLSAEDEAFIKTQATHLKTTKEAYLKSLQGIAERRNRY